MTTTEILNAELLILIEKSFVAATRQIQGRTGCSGTTAARLVCLLGAIPAEVRAEYVPMTINVALTAYDGASL